MEQKSSPLLKSSLTHGIYIGIALVLISVIIYVLGYSFESWVQFTSYPIIIGGVIWAQLAYRKNLEGSMTYGQAVGIGFLSLLFAGIISAIYTYLLYKVIDPSLHEKLMIFTEQKILEQGRVQEEQLDMVMNITKKFMTPFVLSLQLILYSAIGGLIISLITAIFTKKDSQY